jgi:hypothetical protein
MPPGKEQTIPLLRGSKACRSQCLVNAVIVQAKYYFTSSGMEPITQARFPGLTPISGTKSTG